MNVKITEEADERQTVALIVQLRQASTAAEAIWVIQALSETAGKAAIAPSIEVLNHHHSGVRAAAVEALVQLGSDTIKPLILAFRASGDRGVQAHIIQALAKIGDRDATDLLVEVLGVADRTESHVRRVAARGLGRIGRNAVESGDLAIASQCLEPLSRALRTDEDWALRYAAAVSLEEIGNSEAIAFLQGAIAPESDSVVQARISMALDRRALT